MKHGNLGAFLLLTVAAVLATTAIAVGGGSDDAGPPPDRPAWTEAPRADAVPPGLAERFAVLRRPRNARDELQGEVGRVTAAHSTESFGANVHLARRVADAHGGLFLVPGRTGACLVSADGGTTCNAIESAREMQVLGTTTGIGHGFSDGEYNVAGIAVDGVDSVTLHMADGRALDLPVANNVYTTDVKGEPESVEWDGPDGHRELAVPH